MPVTKPKDPWSLGEILGLVIVIGAIALCIWGIGSWIKDLVVSSSWHEAKTEVAAKKTTPAPAPKPTPQRVCKPACDVQPDCRAVKRWEFPILTSDHLGQGRYDCSMLSAIPVNPQGLEDRSGCLWCEVK